MDSYLEVNIRSSLTPPPLPRFYSQWQNQALRQSFLLMSLNHWHPDVIHLMTTRLQSVSKTSYSFKSMIWIWVQGTFCCLPIRICRGKFNLDIQKYEKLKKWTSFQGNRRSIPTTIWTESFSWFTKRRQSGENFKSIIAMHQSMEGK